MYFLIYIFIFVYIYVTLRLSWHGWPVHECLADAWGIQPLDIHRLLKPHELCGSGFMIPCATAALLCLLSTVQFEEDKFSIPRSVPPAGFSFLKVPANGRCFLTALSLVTDSASQQRDTWGSYLRTHTGMPLDMVKGCVDHQRLVLEEACGFFLMDLYLPVIHILIVFWTWYRALFSHAMR